MRDASKPHSLNDKPKRTYNKRKERSNLLAPFPQDRPETANAVTNPLEEPSPLPAPRGRERYRFPSPPPDVNPNRHRFKSPPNLLARPRRKKGEPIYDEDGKRKWGNWRNNPNKGNEPKRARHQRGKRGVVDELLDELELFYPVVQPDAGIVAIDLMDVGLPDDIEQLVGTPPNLLDEQQVADDEGAVPEHNFDDEMALENFDHLAQDAEHFANSVFSQNPLAPGDNSLSSAAAIDSSAPIPAEEASAPQTSAIESSAPQSPAMPELIPLDEELVHCPGQILGCDFADLAPHVAAHLTTCNRAKLVPAFHALQTQTV
jgi:hypothetical protein